MDGLIFDIQRFSIHDGPGIRTTVFFKGCPLGCLWCHNPESQSFRPEKLFYEERCVRCGKCLAVCENAFEPSCPAKGECAAVCDHNARETAGRRYTVEDVVRTALRDREFYTVSGGGVTLSGGEPLAQPEFALGLADALRREGVSCAVETCGHVDREILEEAARLTELILFDIKGIDEERHKKNTGRSNRVILSNAEFLMESGANVLFRMPYVPGYNDDELAGVRGFVKGFPLELMAYHNTGAGKYKALSRRYPAADARTPTDEEMLALAKKHDALFSPSGL